MIDPATTTMDDSKGYRRDLVADRFATASIAHKLTIVRRFYQAAVSAGLRLDNLPPACVPRATRRLSAISDTSLRVNSWSCCASCRRPPTKRRSARLAASLRNRLRSREALRLPLVDPALGLRACIPGGSYGPDP